MKYDIEKMNVSIDALDKAIDGNTRSLLYAFDWGKTPKKDGYWSSQYHKEKPLDIPALKEIRRQYYASKSPSIEVGKTYTDVGGRKWTCIVVVDDLAYMVLSPGSTAYTWGTSTGEAISLPDVYNIQLTPDVRTGTVEYINGEPDFDTWKEV